MRFKGFQRRSREEEMREQMGFTEQEWDEAKTGQLRCIGCGKFLKRDADWNQCADCDTRVEGLPAFFA